MWTGLWSFQRPQGRVLLATSSCWGLHMTLGWWLCCPISYLVAASFPILSYKNTCHLICDHLDILILRSLTLITLAMTFIPNMFPFTCSTDWDVDLAFGITLQTTRMG